VGFVRLVRRFIITLSLIAACLLAVAVAAQWWLQAPLPLKAGQTVEVAITPGTTPRGIAHAVVAAGVQTDTRLLWWWFRLSGKERQIKAGHYAITPGTTPTTLLDKLVRGQQSLHTITLIEGWTFRRARRWG